MITNLMCNQFMEIRLIDPSEGRDLRSARIEVHSVQNNRTWVWDCYQMQISAPTWKQAFREAFAITDRLQKIEDILLSIPVEDRGITYAVRED